MSTPLRWARPGQPRTPLCEEAVRALGDLHYFLTYYWGLELHDQPHREMTGAVQQAELSDTTPNVMLIVPRGTYKSSIARGAVVWKQLRQIFLFDNYYHRIAIASATLALTRTTMRTIFNRLQHPLLVQDFGQMIYPRGSKIEDGLNFAPRIDSGDLPSCPEPNLWAASERRTSTGWHADELYADDLHDDKSVKTEGRLESARNYWKLLQPILMPKDRVGRICKRTLNATRWHDADVPGMVLHNLEMGIGKDSWIVVQRGAFTKPGVEDGPLYFPAVLTEEVIEQYKVDLGAYLFSCNILNDPIGDRGFVQTQQIVFRSPELFPDDLRWLRVSVDPNQHTEAKLLGDWAALVVVAYDRYSRMYVLDADGSRSWGPKQLIDRLFQISEKYNEPVILMEDVHMGYFGHAVDLEKAERSRNADKPIKLRIEWVHPTQNEHKYERWQKLGNRFPTGHIVFSDRIQPNIRKEIESQLVRGRASRFDDFLDALAQADVGVRKVADGPTKTHMGKPTAPTMTWSDAFKGVM